MKFLCYNFEYATERNLLIAFAGNTLDSIFYPLLFM